MIAVVGCGAAKRCEPSKARNLYVGNLFRSAYSYARRAGASPIWILSARHGLVASDAVIAPYNCAVGGFNRAELGQWLELVGTQLSALPSGEILALVPAAYERALEPRAADLRNPLRGMAIGQRLRFLKVAS